VLYLSTFIEPVGASASSTPLHEYDESDTASARALPDLLSSVRETIATATAHRNHQTILALPLQPRKEPDALEPVNVDFVRKKLICSLSQCFSGMLERIRFIA
jgi:hypothetical protein